MFLRSIRPGAARRLYSTTRSTPEFIQTLIKSEGGGYKLEHGGLIDFPVNWGDMDVFAHVNNVKYLKWFESARVNMFNKLAEDYKGNVELEKFMSSEGVGPIIRSVNLAWRYPIKFPDTVTVLHKVDRIESDRFFLKGIVISHEAQKVAARIEECVVTVDYRKGGVKAEIPQPVRNALEDRMNGTS